MTIQELQEQKNGLVMKIRELADIPSDNWDADQQRQWDEVNADHDKIEGELKEALESEERAKERVQRLHELETRKLSTKTRTQLSNVVPNPSRRDAELIEADQELRSSRCLKAWLLHANGREVPELFRQSCHEAGFNWSQESFEMRLTPGFRRGNQLSCEQRDLSSGGAGSGAETVPVGFQRELEQALLDFGGIRRISRVITTSREGDLHWPLWNDTANKSTIVGEAADTGASVDPTTSEVIFKSYKYNTKCIVSAEFLDDAFMPMDSVIASDLGTRLGRGTAEHFAVGNSTTQPQGATVGAVENVIGSSSAFTMDDVLTLIHALDPAYRRQGPMLVMNDNTLLEARKLKDTQNRYLWEPSLQVGEASRLFGYPYEIDQDVPDLAVNANFMLFGTFGQHYVIRDHASMRFYRLTELYRQTDQTGFQLLSRHDGRVLDAGTGPIQCLKGAAS